MCALNLVAESSARHRVLPLHLNAAELLMLAQDLPGFPSTFVVQLELRGQIDRGSFEAAIGEALDRHPLLTALIQPGKGGLPCWTAADDRLPPLDWAVDSAPMNCPAGEAIDLAREIGLRIWVRQGAERVRVLFQFHHTCCDGTGAYRFIGDLLACYGARTDTTGMPPALAPVQLQMLRSRTDRLLGGAPSSARIGWPVGLAEFWRILIRRPPSLAPPATRLAKGRTDDFPGFLSMSLDRAEHQRLRSATGERGATLNDLLLRDMFLAMDDWNLQQGARRRADWLRIMMPTDLRDSEDCEMPAANLTSYAFLNRKARKWGFPGELLSSIRAETALIKSRRSGTKFMHMIAWAALAKLDWSTLSKEQKLELLRVYELALYRLGPPDEAARGQLIERLDALYPADQRELNVMLTELLCYLQAPSAAAKGMKLLTDARTQEEQIDFVRSLRVLDAGWTRDLHRDLFQWFHRAAAYKGGNNFEIFMKELKHNCLSHVSDEDRAALNDVINGPAPNQVTPLTAEPRPFVKEWTMAEVMPLVESKLKQRNFEHGRLMFASANCFACHHFAQEGGAVGPDLTGLAGRFSARDILESVLEPNKVISDQYAAVVIESTNGKVIMGRVTNYNGDKITVNTNMLDPNANEECERSEIERMSKSEVSMMPAGLLNTLAEDELLDLMAFLLSRGDPENRMFAQ